jgi:hypothetical protein
MIDAIWIKSAFELLCWVHPVLPDDDLWFPDSCTLVGRGKLDKIESKGKVLVVEGVFLRPVGEYATSEQGIAFFMEIATQVHSLDCRWLVLSPPSDVGP